MGTIRRRSTIRGVAALGVATLARPYIANAAAKTASVWWQQGFVPEEDAAFERMVGEYQKASGNKIDYSIIPFVALNQKMISALQTNDTPDVISYEGVQSTLALNAWNDKLVDVGDVVATQQSLLSETALASTKLYNKVKNERSFYAVPEKCGCQPFHIWGDLVGRAGFKVSEIPNTWDARWNYFKQMQAPLRAKGLRRVYALGAQITTNGPSDGNNLFSGFLYANGGMGLVTPDGKLHVDDPQAKEAVIKTIEFLSNAYIKGFVPPGAISWNDADDNNAFHAKLIMMDFDGTISTELAMIHRPKDYNATVTLGLPLGNDGKPMPAEVEVVGMMIPKAGKNIDVAKDFAKFVIEPQVNNEYLKGGLARWVTVFPSIAKNDPFWLHSDDPHRAPYVTQALLGPSVPDWLCYNPAWAEVEAEQIWGQTYAGIYKDHLTPQAAVERSLKRVESIFSRYQTS